MGIKKHGAVCIVFVSGLAVTVSAHPALIFFIPGQLVPLEGGKGLGYLVAQGGAVAFPLPVLSKPLGTALFFVAVGFDLCFGARVAAVGVRLGAGKAPDTLKLFRRSSCRCPRAEHTVLELIPDYITAGKQQGIMIEGPAKTRFFDDLVQAQLDYQQKAKADPTWTKRN